MLDELDQLESKGQDVLYTLFEWPQLPSSRLVLVGEYAGCSTATLGTLPLLGRLMGSSLYSPLLGEQPSSFSSPRSAGLANALDLTDRSLARLKAHPAGSPQLLHFTPYTKEQLTRILQERLGQVGTQAGQRGGTGGPLPTRVAALIALVPHRCLVTPWWTLLLSSSVPARSLPSLVMLARPWMSVGQCVCPKTWW